MLFAKVKTIANAIIEATSRLYALKSKNEFITLDFASITNGNKVVYDVKGVLKVEVDGML